MDLTVIETARFGKTQEHDRFSMSRDFENVVKNLRHKRPSNYQKPRSRILIL